MTFSNHQSDKDYYTMSCYDHIYSHLSMLIPVSSGQFGNNIIIIVIYGTLVKFPIVHCIVYKLEICRIFYIAIPGPFHYVN